MYVGDVRSDERTSLDRDYLRPPYVQTSIVVVLVEHGGSDALVNICDGEGCPAK